MKEVGVVRVHISNVRDLWHIVVDDEVDFGDVNASGQDIGTDQGIYVFLSKFVDDLVSLSHFDSSDKFSSFYSLLAELLLQISGHIFFISKYHLLAVVKVVVYQFHEHWLFFFIHLHLQELDSL